MAQILSPNSYISTLQTSVKCKNTAIDIQFSLLLPLPPAHLVAKLLSRRRSSVRCSGNQIRTLRTCRNCKTQFDPLLNQPQACRYHSAHFGGETKRKFESVYTGGTMDTPDSGKVFQYWHCCGSEDPFDPGCIAAPHSSYDD